MIRSKVRPYDLVIRLGGAEFLCVMSELTLTDAHRRLHEIAAILATADDASANRTGSPNYKQTMTHRH